MGCRRVVVREAEAVADKSRARRDVTFTVRRETRRRAAVEPVIGHLKDDHRMGRNHLKGRDGDRINAVLAAAGYNFSLLRRWFEVRAASACMKPRPKPLPLKLSGGMICKNT